MQRFLIILVAGLLLSLSAHQALAQPQATAKESNVEKFKKDYYEQTFGRLIGTDVVDCMGQEFASAFFDVFTLFTQMSASEERTRKACEPYERKSAAAAKDKKLPAETQVVDQPAAVTPPKTQRGG